MNTSADDHLVRQSLRVRVQAQRIGIALAKRPGSVAPDEHRTVIEMINDMARGCPAIMHAPADRQLVAALGFLHLWQSVLDPVLDCCWPDPDEDDQ